LDEEAYGLTRMVKTSTTSLPPERIESPKRDGSFWTDVFSEYALSYMLLDFFLRVPSSRLLDIKDMRTIGYNRQSLAKTLQKPLAEAFRETLGRYEVRSESRRVPLPPKMPYTIAVTGSMEADAGKCRRRLEALLQPYLGDQTTWYCGSYGGVDEATIKYLVERRQRVVVVGYHAYDISPRTLELIELHQLPFVDARKEQLPKALNAPTERDLVYLTRADLLIVLWNGSGEGTRSLINWYQKQQKDLIIGFI
jgi:hypothetical protein